MSPEMNLVETDRLLLRLAKKDDFESLYTNVFSKEVVSKYVFSGGVLSYENAINLFEKQFNFNGASVYGFLVLVEKSSNNIIGFSGLIPARHSEHDGYEFGYVLSESSWGKGYATEIAIGQIKWALNDLGLKRVYALVSKGNTASMHVVEKLKLSKAPSVFIEDQGECLVYVAESA